MLEAMKAGFLHRMTKLGGVELEMVGIRDVKAHKKLYQKLDKLNYEDDKFWDKLDAIEKERKKLEVKARGPWHNKWLSRATMNLPVESEFELQTTDYAYIDKPMYHVQEKDVAMGHMDTLLSGIEKRHAELAQKKIEPKKGLLDMLTGSSGKIDLDAKKKLLDQRRKSDSDMEMARHMQAEAKRLARHRGVQGVMFRWG